MDLAFALEDSQPFKLTVDQYHDLMEQGVIEERSRVELIEGMIVRMNEQTVVHVVIVNELTFRLQLRLREIGSPLVAYVNATVAIQPHNAPDPDIMVGERPTGRGFMDKAGVRLLIEVSHTTLRKDIGFKRDLYADAGVLEYWVVDADKALVHRFWQPDQGRYVAEKPVSLGGPLASLTIPDLVIDGAGIL